MHLIRRWARTNIQVREVGYGAGASGQKTVDRRELEGEALGGIEQAIGWASISSIRRLNYG